MPSSEILRADNLSRWLPERRIVTGVTFSVAAGELVAIAGPSGAGKSSLLRLLNRLDEPTSGTVMVEGRDYRQIPSRELRRRVGMVMQRPFLFPGSVVGNIRFGPQQRGESLDAAAIASLLERMGLSGYETRDSSTLSGGEAQRVSLARALANRPCVLLLDEPTSALDDESKRQIEDIIREIVASDRLTCLMVTHDTAQAARLASRVILMRGGKLERMGTVNEVLNAKSDF